MPVAKCTDEEFIAAYRKFKNAADVAQLFKMDPQRVMHRRKSIEERYGIVLETHDFYHSGYEQFRKAYPLLNHVELKSGIVLIGSDAHYWPGFESTAHDAFVEFCIEFKPKIVILNGDIYDFPQISRHHRIGWSIRPTLKVELDTANEKIYQIERAAKGAIKKRTPGNHCLRMEGFVSNRVPELEGVAGTKLSYYLPKWEAAWAIRINKDQLHVTHRMLGGKYAARRSAEDSGMSVCIGHHHAANVYRITKMDRTFYGVDAGAIADVSMEADWPQFEYQEGRSRDMRSGFAFFEFENYKLMPPELVEVREKGKVWFRGKHYNV